VFHVEHSQDGARGREQMFHAEHPLQVVRSWQRLAFPQSITEIKVYPTFSNIAAIPYGEYGKHSLNEFHYNYYYINY